MLALALVISAPMSQAQSRVIANVPFAFSLEQSSMPAGGYEISWVNQHVIAVQNLETRQSRFVIASVHVQASQAQPPKLVFQKYGDHYFLRQIWDSSGAHGIELPASKAEKELNMASNNFSDGPETVIIAMK
jgi:hypothetical protein